MTNDAIINGIRPRRGMWLVHRAKGRTYGRIIRVTRDGDVIWLGVHGAHVLTTYRNIHKCGCEYAGAPLEVTP